MASGAWGTGGAGGDVEGPASSTDNNLAKFGDTTGKVLEDSGIATANVVTAASALTDARVVVSSGGAKGIAVSAVTATTLGYLDATSSIQTQLNSKGGASVDRYLPYGSIQAHSQANNTTYYFKITAGVTKTATGIEVYIDAAGADNGIDVALYDAAGTTLLASRATPLASFSAGPVRIAFDTAYASYTAGTVYWVGIGNANGGTATFSTGPTGVNSSDYARVDNGVPTCGATLPTGASTNARIVMAIY